MDSSLVERFARESGTPGEIAKKFRQAGIALTMYKPRKGMHVQWSYRHFNFDGSSGARWRAFWESRMFPLANVDDAVLFHHLISVPIAGPPRGDLSALPGLDEQWLADADHLETIANRPGMNAAVLREAAVKYEEVARATGSPAALERLGAVLLRLGEGPRGFGAFREAEKRGRKTAVCYTALGVSEALANRVPRAVDLLYKALSLNPGLADARRNLVLALLRTRRRDEAIRVLMEGLRITPQDPGLRGLRANIFGAKAEQR
jgi:tetratricopeptide (TPR) repeat protein